MNPFSDRPYFPMMLANGTDCALIDWGGTMRSCDKGLEHIDRYWYKADRRDKAGNMLPHIYCGYMLIFNGEQHLVRTFEQDFDPASATLKTKAEACGFQFTVETFLTDEHVLVENFCFSKIPDGKGKAEIEFIVSRPDIGESTKEKICHSFAAKKSKAGEYISADYSYGKSFNGQILMFCDQSVSGCETGDEIGRLSWSGGRLIVDDIKPGTRLTRYTIVADDKDFAEPLKAVNKIRRDILSCGYAEVRKRHQRRWKRFQNLSKIKTGDAQIDRQYMLSNYILRAQQNPLSGATATGMYPWLWQGKIFWDTFFFHEAMLRGNRIEEAAKLAGFWKKTLPRARKNTKEWNKVHKEAQGARYGWCTDHTGYCDHLKIIDELHNNPVVATMAFRQFLFTNDREALKDLFPVIKEAMDFVLTGAIKETAKEAVIINCEGVDESTRVKRGNDTWTAGATIAGLSSLVEAARELAIDINPKYERLLAKLRQGLFGNLNKKGEMLAARGAATPSFGSMVYLLDPEFPGARKTMNNIWRSRKKNGSVAQYGCPRQDASTVPWFEAWAAAIWANLGDGEKAEYYLNESLKSASIFGALPEQVRPDGSGYKYWTGTAHACFSLALSRMMVNVVGTDLQIFCGVPKSWLNCKFSDLRVAPGLLVSAEIARGKIKKLLIKNTARKKVSLRIRLRHDLAAASSLDKKVTTLKAGEKQIF